MSKNHNDLPSKGAKQAAELYDLEAVPHCEAVVSMAWMMTLVCWKEGPSCMHRDALLQGKDIFSAARCMCILHTQAMLGWQCVQPHQADILDQLL